MTDERKMNIEYAVKSIRLKQQRSQALLIELQISLFLDGRYPSDPAVAADLEEFKTKLYTEEWARLNEQAIAFKKLAIESRSRLRWLIAKGITEYQKRELVNDNQA